MKHLHNKVALIGPAGSFSESGGLAQFVANRTIPIPDEKLVRLYCDSIDEVMAAVLRGDAVYGVLPVLNTGTGIIEPSVRVQQSGEFQILETAEVRISYVLAAYPGTSIEDVAAIYSHQQSLKQCTATVARLLPDAKTIVEKSTSASMKRVQDEKGKAGAAALGPERAAVAAGLHILKEHMEDNHYNSTVFVLFAKAASKSE